MRVASIAAVSNVAIDIEFIDEAEAVIAAHVRASNL